jgi:hypothetical protein
MILTLVAINSAHAELTHRYSFKDGVKDSVGKVDGTLKGNAKATDGKLTLDNADKSSSDANIAYVEFSGPLLPKKGSATIIVWFTAKEAAAFSRLLDIGSKDDTAGAAFVYLTPRNGDDASRAAITATDAASKSAVDGERLDDGKPHMAAIVIDGNAKKLHLYVDGKEMGTPADLGDNTLDQVKQEHAWIGRSAFDGDGALSATINELRVYDEALTFDQTKAVFKAGSEALPTAK